MAEANITPEHVLELLNYDPLTGIFTWKNPRSPRMKPGDVAGSANNLGYILIYIDGLRYRAHRVAWFVSYGHWPENEVDHINGIRSDNRIVNLRDVDRSGNMHNASGKLSGNSTGVQGVHKVKKKYLSAITVNGKRTVLGRFNTLEEAESAYQAAKTEVQRTIYANETVQQTIAS